MLPNPKVTAILSPRTEVSSEGAEISISWRPKLKQIFNLVPGNLYFFPFLILCVFRCVTLGVCTSPYKRKTQFLLLTFQPFQTWAHVVDSHAYQATWPSRFLRLSHLQLQSPHKNTEIQIHAILSSFSSVLEIKTLPGSSPLYDKHTLSIKPSSQSSY